MHHALCTLHHDAPCTMHNAPCTVHCTLCTMHSALCRWPEEIAETRKVNYTSKEGQVSARGHVGRAHFMLRCSGHLELGPEWLRFLWLSAAAEKLGVEFDRSGLHGWLAIRRLRRREAEMYERREAEAERKAVAERERRDAEDRERRKEAERAEQWRRAEEKRRITRQQDEMREREACKREDEEAGGRDGAVDKEDHRGTEQRAGADRLHASAVRPRSRDSRKQGK